MRRISTVVLMAALALGFTACSQNKGDVGQGRELARALGCGDCHGADFAGHKVSHNDAIVVLHSANLTRAVPTYSDDALRTVLTSGVRPDGTRLWQMDAAPYAVLSPSDMANLVAFLRTLPPTGQAHPRIKTSAAFDQMVQAGQVRPESLSLAKDRAHPPAAMGDHLERGRYLARTYCAGCHGPSLRGFQPPQPGDPPDLVVAGAYSRTEFQTLLHEGRGRAGRDVGEMAEAARKRFAGVPTADVDALYDYLHTWSQRRTN